MRRSVFIILCCLFHSSIFFCQSNSDFKLSGSTSVFLEGNTGLTQKNNFQYRSSSSIRLSRGKFSVAGNLQLIDGRSSFQLNRPELRVPSRQLLGFSPEYKWIKAHVGFRSLSFNKYSLNGTAFNGIGLELSPGNFQLKSFFGSIKNANSFEPLATSELSDRPSRKAWGSEIGYTMRDHSFSISILSISEEENNNSGPDENLVLGITASSNLSDMLQFKLEYVFSALSRNASLEKIDESSVSFWRTGFGLFKSRLGSSYGSALNHTLEWTTSFGKISASHERIGPGYVSYGALFLNNDFENITAGISFHKNGLPFRVNGKIGYQRNGLTDATRSRNSRTIMMINGFWTDKEAHSFNLTFSNFNTTSIQRMSTLPFIQEDSLRIALTNLNFQSSYSYSESSRKVDLTISFQRSQMNFSNPAFSEQENSSVVVGASYLHIFPAITVHSGIQMNKNTLSEIDNLTVAPYVGFNGNWLNDKLKGGLTMSFVRWYQDGAFASTIWQPRASLSWVLNRTTRISLNSWLTHSFKNNITNADVSRFQTRLQAFKRW